MTKHTLILWAVVAASAGAGCSVNDAAAPTPTGPSDYATSINVTANPDTVVLNGQQSIILIVARDATGAPLPNLRLHLDVIVGGQASVCGRLSTSDVITDINGRATSVFTAPTLPLPLPECSGLGRTVSVRAFAVGTNAQVNNITFTASINLLAPSSNATASAFAVNFAMTPNPASVNGPITFNNAGSVSPGHTITTFDWSFGDSTPNKSGSSVVHDYGASGSYIVSLTITDDIGQSGFKTALLTIR